MAIKYTKDNPLITRSMEKNHFIKVFETVNAGMEKPSNVKCLIRGLQGQSMQPTEDDDNG